MIDIYTVYNSPKDYPGKIVVRRWRGDVPDATAMEFEDLDAARAYLTKLCLVRLPRDHYDDPCIAEVWL